MACCSACEQKQVSWSPSRLAGLGSLGDAPLVPPPTPPAAAAMLRVYDVIGFGLGGLFFYMGDKKTGGALAALSLLDIVARNMNSNFDAVASSIPFIGQKVL